MKGEWLRKPASDTSVVFVHGILSSGETCWKHENGSYWPELLNQESDLGALGIYVFTYQTGIFSGSYSLSDVVDSLKEFMRLDKVLTSKQIIFVCHSMGGIVVRKFLVERVADLIASKTDIVLFLVASPSLGSSYADWLSPLAQFLGHTQAAALGFSQSNVWLHGLDKEFKNLKEANSISIKGKELIEDQFVVLKKLWRKQVVEPFSGASYFGESIKIPLSDHFSIAKPENKAALQHRLLCQFIKDNLLLTPSLQNLPPVTNDSTLKSQELQNNFSITATQSGKSNIALQHIKDSNITINLNQGATPISSTTAQRILELAYLDYIEEKKLRNIDRYTPMAGTSLSNVPQPQMDMVFELTPIGKDRQQPIRRFENVVGEILQLRRAVLLGEPGGGKTTTIRKLAHYLVDEAKQNFLKPIPLLVRLGEWTIPDQSLLEFIAAQLGELGQHLNTLLDTNRAALLLDGLNELPIAQRENKYPKVQEFLYQNKQLLAVVSCREQDYKDDYLDFQYEKRVAGMMAPDDELEQGEKGDFLDFNRIVIIPLDPLRIQKFVRNYLGNEKGNALFWELIGKETSQKFISFLQTFQRQTSTQKITPLSEQVSLEFCQSWHKESNEHWQQWLNPSSLLVLAQNPFMLQMLASVYFHRGELPKNQGDLFRDFVDALLLRERKTLLNQAKKEAVLQEQENLTHDLACLAFEMQQLRNTALPKAETLQILTDQQLYLAVSASILSTDEQVRFSHQLLQEYFAAKFMDNLFQKEEDPAKKIWRRESWWEPKNLEEPSILLAGFYGNDCTNILNWLSDANPEVAAKCIIRSGAETPESTKDILRKLWVPRLNDLQYEHDPRARAAIGRAIGLIGVKPDALPQIDWVEITDGEFQYGSKEEYAARPKILKLSTFKISCYPITYAQFQTFLDDTQGFSDKRWFEGWSVSDDKQQMPIQAAKYYDYPYTNHPRETVNWYQAMAFCRWLSWRLGGGYNLKNVSEWVVRLPTEFEWEKAARGTTGYSYPYKGTYDPAKGNTIDTEINMTCAVGIFPNGASPEGVMDMSGNVSEWCLSSYYKPTIEERAENLLLHERRVLRGGSWNSHKVVARATARGSASPSFHDDATGFRLIYNPSLQSL